MDGLCAVGDQLVGRLFPLLAPPLPVEYSRLKATGGWCLIRKTKRFNQNSVDGLSSVSPRSSLGEMAGKISKVSNGCLRHVYLCIITIIRFSPKVFRQSSV